MRWLAERWRGPTLAALAVVVAVAQTTGREGLDPREAGLRIYQEAREAAGAGSSADPIQDYTLELTTRLNTPKGEVEVRSRVYFLFPALIRQEVETPNGKVVVIFDGEKGWQSAAGSVQHLPAEATQTIQADLARSHVLFHTPPRADTVRYLRQDKVGERAVDVIELSDVGGTPLRLFVDQESRDVLKKMFVGDVPGGGMAQVEETYSEFTEVDGYRWHQRRQVLRNGKFALESSAANVRLNVGLQKTDIIR